MAKAFQSRIHLSKSRDEVIRELKRAGMDVRSDNVTQNNSYSSIVGNRTRPLVIRTKPIVIK